MKQHILNPTNYIIQLNEIVDNVIDIPFDDRTYKKTKHTISSYLGKIFKNTPLFVAGKVHGGYVKYTFEPTNLLKFIEIRNYTEYFKEEDLEKLRQAKLPIQPIQSIPPIQSIQSIPTGEVGEVDEGGNTSQGIVEDCSFCHKQEGVIVVEDKIACPDCYRKLEDTSP